MIRFQFDLPKISSLADKIRSGCFVEKLYPIERDAKDTIENPLSEHKLLTGIKTFQITRDGQLHRPRAIPLLEEPFDLKDSVDIDRAAHDFCQEAAIVIWRFQKTLGDKEKIAISLLTTEIDVDRRRRMLTQILNDKGGAFTQTDNKEMDNDIDNHEGQKLKEFLNSAEGRYETDQKERSYGFIARENKLIGDLRALICDFLKRRGLFEPIAKCSMAEFSERQMDSILVMILRSAEPWQNIEERTLFERIRRRRKKSMVT